jgi:ketosteroid isomerase-like protein
VQRDTATLSQLLAPEFVGVGPQGTFDRRRTLADLTESTPRAILLAAEDSARTVRVYGDAALATAHSRRTYRITRTGEQTRNDTRYTEMWVRRGDQWQAVAGVYLPFVPEKPSALAQLREAERTYVHALNRRDTMELTRVVSDSAMLVSGPVAISDKRAFLARMSSVPGPQLTATVDRAYVSGDMAVTAGTTRQVGRGAASRQRFTRTWIYRASRWRLLGEHLSQ